MSSAATQARAVRPVPVVGETWMPRISSVGSTYWALCADPEVVVRLARSGLQKSFRRVFLDPVRGLIMLMSPARVHERISELAGDVIKTMAGLLNQPLVSLRSTRWRKPSAPPNTGAEPDCCFYVGEQAQAYLAAEALGEDAADQFVCDHPPDIVVEVGVTHFDAAKQDFYGDLGVPEHWRLDRSKDAPPSARFLSLQNPDGPRPLAASTALPSMTPQLFAEALQSAARPQEGRCLALAVGDLMRMHGVPVGRPGPDDDGGGFAPP